MKKEIIEKLKEVKTKIKTMNKKDDYEEYLRLRDERLKLEAELAEIKKKYYAAVEQSAKIRMRKGNDHKKFIYGGLIVKYFGYISAEELEKKLQNIINNNQNINQKSNKDDDMNEYFDSVVENYQQ